MMGQRFQPDEGGHETQEEHQDHHTTITRIKHHYTATAGLSKAGLQLMQKQKPVPVTQTTVK